MGGRMVERGGRWPLPFTDLAGVAVSSMVDVDMVTEPILRDGDRV